MNIFLTGGTGYTGTVVLERFLAEGFQVMALRRPKSRSVLSDRMGLCWISGDFSNSTTIADAARRADAIVHIGATHAADMETADKSFIQAVTEAILGSGKVFVTTSATPVYGDTGLVRRDEREPILHPPPSRSWRVRHDQEVVALNERGVRSVVIRPAQIYGRAGGLLADEIIRAKRTGQARYLGSGLNWASTVHVEALADLYVLALRNPGASGIYNAVSDDVCRAIDLARAIAAIYGPGIEAVSWPLDEARKQLGELVDLAIITCVASSLRARTELGWEPTAPPILAELIGGSYYTGPLWPYREKSS